MLTSAGVQVVVGLVLAPPTRWTLSDLRGRAAVLTVIAYAAAGAAMIAYLLALAEGPAAAVVPLVATSPALAGLLGVLILREKTSSPRLIGIAAALAGAALLGVAG